MCLRAVCPHCVNGSLAIADPLSLEASSFAGGFNGCPHFKAQMRPFVVVEHDSTLKGLPHLVYIRENHILEEFILERVVYALRLGVVFGISAFRHAYHYFVLAELRDIVGTGILYASVAVMYGPGQINSVSSKAVHRSRQCLHRVSCFKRHANAAAQYHLAV